MTQTREKKKSSTDRRYMKIGQLTKESGCNRSTIHHYLNLGLLPAPVRVGLNVHLYDQSHLDRLLEIKRLRKQNKMPLAKIKAVLEQREEEISGLEEDEFGNSQADDFTLQQKREQIMAVATELFSRKGYEAVRISDIANTLHMGKSTFYVYFPSKEDLFMDCIGRLNRVAVPPETWDEIGRERDLVTRMAMRAKAFFTTFTHHSGLIDQARMAASSDDPKLAQKARNAFKLLTEPMRQDLLAASSQGHIRRMDLDLVAYMLLFLAECLGFKYVIEADFDLDKALGTLVDVIWNGIGAEGGARQAEHMAVLTDQSGASTRLTDLRFDAGRSLEVHLGEGRILLEPGKVRLIRVEDPGPPLRAECLLVSGDSAVVSIDPGHMLSGQSPLGPFSISLDRIRQIAFV